jgi:hypothetical protein
MTPRKPIHVLKIDFTTHKEVFRDGLMPVIGLEVEQCAPPISVVSWSGTAPLHDRLHDRKWASSRHKTVSYYVLKRRKSTPVLIGGRRIRRCCSHHRLTEEKWAKEHKDTERTNSETVSEKKTVNVAEVEVVTTLKDTVEMRGDKDEQGGKQGTEERNESEGVVTSQEIQVRGLSQEKDDDDGLPDES